ncbi:hypothetical protein K438DRAFT_1632445 [Mycena galopus ATCC 62051]|nr:hypothetical protein K438DRAFT_1632445 [Mycena galopus ATCC 62051]
MVHASLTLKFTTSARHDNDPETLEREKQRNLSGSQHKTSAPHVHAPGWNEYLASDSEASVKADRSDHPPTDKLQNDTVDYVHSRHGTNQEDAPNHSADKKERTEGPLAGKGNKQ